MTTHHSTNQTLDDVREHLEAAAEILENVKGDIENWHQDMPDVLSGSDADTSLDELESQLEKSADQIDRALNDLPAELS